MKKLSLLFRRFTELYSEQYTLENKIFWGVVPLAFVVGLGSLTGTIAERLGILPVISAALCVSVPLFFIIVCYRHGNDCKRYYKLFCLALNCVLMPLTFLTNGGIHSGMPMYCSGLFLLGAFCSNRHDRHVTSASAFFVYLAVFILSKHFPSIVMPIRESFIETDIILSFAVCSVSMMIIISKAVNEYNTQRYREVNNGLIDSLSAIIEFRSLETGNHVHNIKQFTASLLKAANTVFPDAHFSASEINTISSAAVLHDIGKIAVPDSILNKPGKLTESEYEIIKKHPLDGCRMIETMRDFQNKEYYEYCYEICRHHHERYDGKGYPDGLKGNEIPLISQLVSIADVYEALTSERVYKEVFSLEKASDTILAEKGKMFSENAILCFLLAKPELEALVCKNKSEVV